MIKYYSKNDEATRDFLVIPTSDRLEPLVFFQDSPQRFGIASLIRGVRFRREQVAVSGDPPHLWRGRDGLASQLLGTGVELYSPCRQWRFVALNL
jgi:hypothetical protein